MALPQQFGDHRVVRCLAGAGREEHDGAGRIGDRVERVAACHLGAEIDPVARAFQREAGCELGDVVLGRRHEDDVELKLVEAALVDEIPVVVKHPRADGVRAADQLEPAVTQIRVDGVVDAFFPVPEPQGGVLARGVVGAAVIGLDPQDPEVGVGGLEVGDRRVVVLLAEFLDRALVAVTSSLAGLDAFGVEFRKAGGHVEADAVAR